MATPTADELNDERDTASLSAAEGTTRFPGMTYEEGVKSALDWVLGDTDIKPTESD
jgi:hypothetical protein